MGTFIRGKKAKSCKCPKVSHTTVEWSLVFTKFSITRLKNKTRKIVVGTVSIAYLSSTIDSVA